MPKLNLDKGFYSIFVNKRPNFNKAINVPIAKVGHIQLDFKNLGDLFELINKHTIHKPYPYVKDIAYIKGNPIYRYNHNITHSLRLIRLLEAIFDLTVKKGKTNLKHQLNSLTKEERLHLLLGAFFLRAGRVDESDHLAKNPDDYNTRSALIYQEYAKQLKANPKTIKWVKSLIFNSCKPYYIRDKIIDTNPKYQMGYQFLTLVHELDLVRIFGKNKFDGHKQYQIQNRLNFITGNNSNYQKFLKFAKDLCTATGSYIYYDGKYNFKNPSQFAKCSLSGKHCYNSVKSVSLPKW